MTIEQKICYIIKSLILKSTGLLPVLEKISYANSHS